MATDIGSAEPVRAADRAPGEPGLRDPLFFVSHANVTGPAAAANANDLFVDFFRELSGHVSQLHYRHSGADPGFMDLELEGGLAWEREVLKSVGTCHVFVALLSSPYVNREWCGLEWCAFRRRRSWRLDRNGWTETNECVVPVLWVPLSEAQTPDPVKEVELFRPPGLDVPGLVAAYRRHGLLGLHTVQPELYTAVVWYLALEINRKLDEYRVEPIIPSDRGELRNAFETGD